jgi:transglutaminase-like putative cysteine protease
MSQRKLTQGIAPLLVILTIVGFAASPATAGQVEWKPVDPAHLALKAPTVEKDSDAEGLFWEMRVEKDIEKADLTHYLRIKIFTERGRDTQSKVELPYLNGSELRDIAGRTIKSDGTIIDLKPEAILDTVLARVGKLKLQAKTFSLPGVEPGAIIEYRWREVHKSSFYTRVHLQRDFPIQRVTFSIKPPPASYSLELKTFNIPDPTFVHEASGMRGATLTNVPAFRPEPQMPPEDEVRMWVLAYYSSSFAPSGARFWTEYGKLLHDNAKSRMKVNDEVRNAMVTAVGDAASPEQKLQRLFEFCHTKIRNINDDASGIAETELARLKQNKSPSDTLKRGMGTGYDINMLFAALATAAGFEARYARVADRSDIFFDRALANDYFLTASDIAVKVGEKWLLYDPASTHIPYGMLRWQEEGNEALVSDPVAPTFVRTPISPPEKSLTKRTAALRLGDDGSLEGDVRIEYSGHVAAQMKEDYDQDSPAEREKSIRDSLKSQLSTLNFRTSTSRIWPTPPSRLASRITCAFRAIHSERVSASFCSQPFSSMD